MSNALVVDVEFEELPLAQAARGEALPAVPQADSDEHLIEMWVTKHASPHAQLNYRMQADRFRAFVAKLVRLVRIGDVQAFAASLE